MLAGVQEPGSRPQPADNRGELDYFRPCPNDNCYVTGIGADPGTVQCARCVYQRAIWSLPIDDADPLSTFPRRQILITASGWRYRLLQKRIPSQRSRWLISA